MKKDFVYKPPQRPAVQGILYDEHLKHTDASHMAPFAGYLIPLWYTSIREEHQAVRQAAGLFDCTHMGILQISGPDAPGFLNAVTTNNIQRLDNHQAQYSYILDANGHVLDDIIVYQRDPEHYLMVVNAANEPKIRAYFQALKDDRVIIDKTQPDRNLTFKPSILDKQQAHQTGLLDLALQGPASLQILSVCLDSKGPDLADLKAFHFTEHTIEGITCVVSRTGYTGAHLGYELLIPHKAAPSLWRLLLVKGQPYGLRPCGLGARDSLRIEAGLPLYGHELAGPYNINPFEAGYGWAIKLNKDFFIGKTAMHQIAPSYTMQVARLRLPGGKGIRPVRAQDAVLDNQGRCIGWVLSAGASGDHQIVLAYIERTAAQEGHTLGVYYLARSPAQARKGKQQTVNKDQVLDTDLDAKVISRFERF